MQFLMVDYNGHLVARGLKAWELLRNC